MSIFGLNGTRLYLGHFDIRFLLLKQNQLWNFSDQKTLFIEHRLHFSRLETHRAHTWEIANMALITGNFLSKCSGVPWMEATSVKHIAPFNAGNWELTTVNKNLPFVGKLTEYQQMFSGFIFVFIDLENTPGSQPNIQTVLFTFTDTELNFEEIFVSVRSWRSHLGTDKVQTQIAALSSEHFGTEWAFITCLVISTKHTRWFHSATRYADDFSYHLLTDEIPCLAFWFAVAEVRFPRFFSIPEALHDTFPYTSEVFSLQLPWQSPISSDFTGGQCCSSVAISSMNIGPLWWLRLWVLGLQSLNPASAPVVAACSSYFTESQDDVRNPGANVNGYHNSATVTVKTTLTSQPEPKNSSHNSKYSSVARNE